MNVEHIHQAVGQKISAAKARFLTLPVRVRITIESVLFALIFFSALIWLGTPYFARHIINQKLANLPDYVGHTDWVEIHPWNASMDIFTLRLDKRGGKIPLPFLSVPKVHLSLQWSQIMHGVFRSSITVHQPRVNLVAGPDEAQSQIGISGIWIDTLKKLIPFRINQLKILDGDLHFFDFHASPQVDLEIQHLQVVANNISNSERKKTPLPATVKITARPLIQGYFEMNISINFDEKYATFSQNFRMEHVPAVAANSALKKYAKVELKSGEIGLYSELTGDKGIYHGYVKPFFYNLVFKPKPEDEGNIGALWSGILNGIKGFFENDNHTIATEGDISGRVDQPNIDPLGLLTGVLWNAYIQALSTGFDPGRSPDKPTDTVTSPQTEHEASANASPAVKAN